MHGLILKSHFLGHQMDALTIFWGKEHQVVSSKEGYRIKSAWELNRNLIAYSFKLSF